MYGRIGLLNSISFFTQWQINSSLRHLRHRPKRRGRLRAAQLRGLGRCEQEQDAEVRECVTRASLALAALARGTLRWGKADHCAAWAEGVVLRYLRGCPWAGEEGGGGSLQVVVGWALHSQRG